jgi:hypothetical protein
VGTLPREFEPPRLSSQVYATVGDASSSRPQEGADTIVWLATLPDDGPTGGFFRDRHAIEW